MERRLDGRTIFFLSVNVLSVACGVLATSKCDFPAIFNFGDSNSDTGGLSALFGQARSPHGETYFHHPAGRFCDGRLIVDFIADSLGKPYLSAYLDSVGSNFSHGANFATAGATIRTQNTSLHEGGFSPISLDIQWNEFFDFQQRSQIFRHLDGTYRALLPKEEFFSKALYTFDIGQNDLTAGYFSNMSASQIRAYIPDVLNRFKSIILYIYGRGGRNFWIHNTGPFGCLAYILDRFLISSAGIDEAGCGVSFNKLAQYFNDGLLKIVVQLRKELPNASITYVDVYSLKYKLYRETRKNGFKESLRACCGHGGRYNYNRNVGCGGKMNVNGSVVEVKSCRDPTFWINWDGVHYTEAANKWIFDQMKDGSSSDLRVPLHMACHAHSN